MNNTNPWRYFRRVGDNHIRRVRNGEYGTLFRRGGGIEPAESLTYYLNHEKCIEITESEAVDILGSCPWEPVPTSATAVQVKYIHKQTIITSITRFSGDAQVTYGGEGRWQHVTETEISEEAVTKMLGCRPWEDKQVDEPQWRYFLGAFDQSCVRRVRNGGCGVIYHKGGGFSENSNGLDWHVKNFREITESEAVDILGGRPWEPALTIEPVPQPATPITDQPPPVPSSAFSVQIGGDHYKKLSIQPIEYCQRNGLGAVESFVVKYVTRWKSKGGVEDLRKAIHLLEMLIEMEAKK